MRFLKEKDMKKILSMDKVITSVERAFLELYNDTVINPKRPIIEIEEKNGSMLYMPCYLKENDALAIKIVSSYKHNPEQGLPTIIATVQLNDSATGQPLAYMEGNHLTAMRTGATSGVATKYLSRKDSQIAGVIGAGVQGRTQLWAICEVRPITQAFVYDIHRKKAETFAETMSKKLDIPIIPTNTAKQTVSKPDILSIATTATEPVLKGEWIQKATHINSVGWVGTSGRELDSQTIKLSKLIVDSKEAVLKESGDILIPLKKGIIEQDHIVAELGDIVANKEQADSLRDQTTLFKSVGLAIEDAITAKLAYKKAKKEDIGTTISIFNHK